MAVAKVTLNGTTLMDTTDATADASKILNTYTAYIGDGSKATGTASGGIDAPTFTVTYDDNWESILSVSCDRTFAQVYDYYNNNGAMAIVIETDQSGTGEYPTPATVSTFAPGENIRYTIVLNWFAAYDILYSSNNVATIVQPSYMDETLNVTTNGTYYPQYGIISEVNVTVPSSAPTLQAKTNIAPSTSSQTITPDTGYDGLSSVQINAMPSGTAGTPTASKGTVSNHSVSVTPSVTNTTGYITGSTKTGTAVTVSASELVSGSQTVTTNGTVDVTNLASVVVNVSGGGSSMNAQSAQSTTRATTSTYTKCVSLTCSKAGTYDVYWSTFRSSTSGTSGSQLYIGGSAYGTADTTTWSNHIQNMHLTGVSISANQEVAVYARSRGSNYYAYVGTLTIIQTA